MMPSVVKIMAVLVVAAMAAGFAAAESGAAEKTTIDFESLPSGEAPPGLATAVTGGGGQATWIVQEDSSAPSGRKVLTQTSADPIAKRFTLCLYDGTTTRDVDLSVHFKPIAGKIDQAAGLVWRYRDSANYYLVRANALENNVVLYKVEGGKRSDLKPLGAGLLAYGKKVEVPTGQWGTLRVVATGKRFAVNLNGEHLFDVEDDTFTAPGKAGLWTKADSVTSFDDLTIEVLDRP